MIPLKRIDHISMAAADWRTQSAKLERLLGFKFKHSWEAHPGQDFSGSVSQVRGTGIEFEVIQPAREGSFVQKFLDQQGPGLHHITAEVEDMDETVAELKRQGIEPFGGVSNDGDWTLTYIHPRDSGGILFQLFVPNQPGGHEEIEAGGGVVNLQRIDHVSMAVADIDKQVEWLERVMGFKDEGRFEIAHQGLLGCNLSIPGSKLRFEVIAPANEDSFVQKFIDTRRPGMHHVCCEVASVQATADALKAEGIEPFGGVIQSDWKPHTFLHPRDSGGVLFQLFEERERRD
ncbi:VOC family protein [bacterium]|nr:VOC family protein [bacterium]